MGRMEEILLILGIVILLFGAKKIPELAKGLGQGIREFKKASNEATKEAEKLKEGTKPNDSKPDSEVKKEG
jgi:sec-independent protein translocase protein TatA